MSLKHRLERLERQRKRNSFEVPIAIFDGDEVQVAGETMRRAEYDARYGPLIEEALARGSTQPYSTSATAIETSALAARCPLLTARTRPYVLEEDRKCNCDARNRRRLGIEAKMPRF